MAMAGFDDLPPLVRRAMWGEVDSYAASSVFPAIRVARDALSLGSRAELPEVVQQQLAQLLQERSQDRILRRGLEYERQHGTRTAHVAALATPLPWTPAREKRAGK